MPNLHIREYILEKRGQISLLTIIGITETLK